jgi:hypothetical protein
MGQRTAAANLTIGGSTIYSEALTYDVRNRVLTKSRTVNSLGSSSDTLTYMFRTFFDVVFCSILRS